MWQVLEREREGGGAERERDNLEDTDVDGRIISKWIFKKWHGRAWTGLICLRIGTGGRRLSIW